MSTRTQARAFAKGTTAALARTKDLESTALILYHNLDDARLAGVLRQIQSHLVGARLVIAPQGISKNEDRVKAMTDQITALQSQLDAQRGTVVSPEWITLTAAATRLHKSYSTLWRAHRDGRLTTKGIGGKERELLMCDPTTYRAKGRGKK